MFKLVDTGRKDDDVNKIWNIKSIMKEAEGQCLMGLNDTFQTGYCNVMEQSPFQMAYMDNGKLVVDNDEAQLIQNTIQGQRDLVFKEVKCGKEHGITIEPANAPNFTHSFLVTTDFNKIHDNRVWL